MFCRRSIFAVLLLLVASTPAAAQASGGSRRSAFSRAKRELAGAHRETATSALAALTAAKEAAAAVTGGAETGEGSTIQQAMVDVWATNPALKIARRLMKGEGVGDFIPELLGGAELMQVFSNKTAAHTVINRFPMFQAFEGVQELAAKNLDDFTEGDGLKVLESFRNFAKRGATAMAMVADPERYVEFLGQYADLVEGDAPPANEREGRLKTLLRAVQGGDREAAREFHDLVAGDIWGNAIDLKALGSHGTEPATLKQLRELAMSDPDMWSLITQGDPLAEKLLADPTFLFKTGAYE